jgi:hypothetical protein
MRPEIVPPFAPEQLESEENYNMFAAVVFNLGSTLCEKVSRYENFLDLIPSERPTATIAYTKLSIVIQHNILYY